MKNKKLIIFILVIVILLTGGLLFVKKSNDNASIELQKKRIEEYIRYNYNEVDSVTFTDSKKVPTGGTYINGYINNDENLNFSGWLIPSTFEGGVDISPELNKLAKYENNKTPKEIEKEKSSSNKDSASNSYLNAF